MKINSLEMLSAENIDEKPPPFLNTNTLSKKQLRHQQARGKYESEWLRDPGQYAPERSWSAQEHLIRSWNLLNSHTKPQGLNAVDLGCGSGWFAQKLAQHNATVTAVDVSSNALKNLRQYPHNNIRTLRDFAPYTTLEDGKYDVAIALDLIAELDPRDHRILISELARLTHKNGLILISTPLDLTTIAALEKFIELARTELDLIDYILSHHLIENQIAKLLPGSIKKSFLQNNLLGSILEKVTRFFYDRDGVTHIILLGRKKSFNYKCPLNL